MTAPEADGQGQSRVTRRSEPSAAILTFATNVGIAAVSLASVLIVARALGPSGRGAVALLTTIAIVTQYVATLGVQEANVNFGSADAATRSTLATNSVVLALLLGCAAAGMLGALATVFPGIAGNSRPALLWLALGSVPVQLVGTYLYRLVQADYRFGISNLAWILAPVVNLLANAALYAFGVLSVRSALISWVAGQAVQSVLLLWATHRMCGFARPSVRLARRTVSFGAKIYPATVMNFANYRLDGWLLGVLANRRELGLYSIAVAWAEALFFLPTAVGYAQRPHLVRGSSEDANSRAATGFRLAVLVTVPLALGMIIAAPFLCVTVFGPRFRGSIVDLRVLVLGAFGILALKLLGNALTARGMPLRQTAATAVAFVCTVALDVLLIPSHGGLGASLASTLAYSAGGAAIIAIYIRTTRVRTRALVPAGSDLRLLLGQLRRALGGVLDSSVCISLPVVSRALAACHNAVVPDQATWGDVAEPIDDAATAGSFAHYARIIRRRRLTVFLVLAAALVAGAAVTYRQQPLYQAQSKIVVGQGSTLFQAQNGNSIQPFTATMSELVTSNVVAQRVTTSLGLNESPTALLKNVSVSINPLTAVMVLNVNDHSAHRAQQINAAFGGAFALLVQQRFGRGPSSPVNGPPISATVFDPAHVLPGKVSPSPARNLVIAAVLGLLLGLAAAFLRDHFDRVLRSDDELEAAFDAPVIGRIPTRRRGRRVARSQGTRQRVRHQGRGDVGVVDLAGVWDNRREGGEAYRMLRSTLRSHGTQRPLRTLVVTSVTPGYGKEAVAANLARAFARAGARTLLVEADLHQPLLDEAIGHSTIGLAGVLAGRATLAQAVETNVASEGIQDPGLAQLDFLPGGPALAYASDLLASPRMVELIGDAASAYRYLLIDAPPLLLATDAIDLAGAADGMILVARRDRTRSDQAREIRALVDRLDVHLAGLVITGAGVEVRGSTLDGVALPAPGDGVAFQAAAGRVRASDR